MSSFAEWVGRQPDDPAIRAELFGYDAFCYAPEALAQSLGGAVKTTFSPPSTHWSRRVEYPWVLRRGDLRADHMVLGAGFGPPFALALSRRCGHVVCLDNNADTVALGRRNAALARLCHPDRFENLSHVVGDITDLPFADASFDRVVCVSVLEHLVEPADRDAALNQLLRVLRPGGRLLLTMDVVIDQLPGLGDFHVGMVEAYRLAARLGVAPPTHVEIRSKYYEREDVNLAVLMIRHDKEKAP